MIFGVILPSLQVKEKHVGFWVNCSFKKKQLQSAQNKTEMWVFIISRQLSKWFSAGDRVVIKGTLGWVVSVLSAIRCGFSISCGHRDYFLSRKNCFSEKQTTVKGDISNSGKCKEICIDILHWYLWECFYFFILFYFIAICLWLGVLVASDFPKTVPDCWNRSIFSSCSQHLVRMRLLHHLNVLERLTEIWSTGELPATVTHIWSLT